MEKRPDFGCSTIGVPAGTAALNRYWCSVMLHGEDAGDKCRWSELCVSCNPNPEEGGEEWERRKKRTGRKKK